MILDFIDHNRADARTGVRRARGGGELGRELFFAGADDVTSKGDAVGLRAETETMAVAGQVGIGIGAKKINIIASGAQRKTVVGAGGRVEVGFGKESEPHRGKPRVVRDAEFCWRGWIVREKPAANVHDSGGGSKQLDKIKMCR